LLLYTLKRYDEALAAFERAIEIDASVVGDWTYKGEIYHDLKRYNEALIALARDSLGFLFGEERIHLLVVETLLVSTVATASHGVRAHREQGHKEESKTYLSPSDGLIRVLMALLAGLANLS
jgi:tetratricopeptide (TPR) repeat protein